MASPTPPTARLHYTRSFMLEIRRSPLVCPPEGLKPLKEWYGDYEAPHTPHHKTTDLPHGRGPQRTERNPQEQRRNQREVHRATEQATSGEPTATTEGAQQFGAMGDFRLPARTARRSDPRGNENGREEQPERGDNYRSNGEAYRSNNRDGQQQQQQQRGERRERPTMDGNGRTSDRQFERRDGRAEEGGWRTVRPAGGRMDDGRTGGRMDDGRRDRQANDRNDRGDRRDRDPAWMEDERPKASNGAWDGTPNATTWKVPKAEAKDTVELGGHVDKLQAFKAQMKAQADKEKGIVAPAPKPQEAEKPTQTSALSLADLGLKVKSANELGLSLNATSPSAPGVDPAISSMSGLAPSSSTGMDDTGSRPRGSRFAKFFSEKSGPPLPPAQPAPAPATAFSPPPANHFASPSPPSIAPASSAPRANNAQSPPIPMQGAGGTREDQASFVRLMDMLHMSSAPRPERPPSPSQARTNAASPEYSRSPAHFPLPPAGPSPPPFGSPAEYPLPPRTTMPPAHSRGPSASDPRMRAPPHQSFSPPPPTSSAGPPPRYPFPPGMPPPPPGFPMPPPGFFPPHLGHPGMPPPGFFPPPPPMAQQAGPRPPPPPNQMEGLMALLQGGNQPPR